LSSGLHADAVRVLAEWTAPDAERAALRVEFAALLAERADGVWRTCAPAHITASALILDETGSRVLLDLHGRVKLWLQMGGHCEPGDTTVAATALREATEESGVPGLRLLGGPVDLDKHAAPCAPGVVDHHFDLRYVAVAPAGAQPVTSSESDDVRWFAVDDLPSATSHDMPRLVAAARDRLPGQPS
jgi:8-oxo-dGTP pyrophosphatase MutT (NUDIX family)